jgi:hypothetical protein
MAGWCFAFPSSTVMVLGVRQSILKRYHLFSRQAGQLGRFLESKAQSKKLLSTPKWLVMNGH